jgi:hypothetical protein
MQLRSAIAGLALTLGTFAITQITALLLTGGFLTPADLLAGALSTAGGLAVLWLVTEPHVWNTVGFEFHRAGYAQRMEQRRRGVPAGVKLRVSQPNTKETWLDWVHIQAEAYGEVAPHAHVDAFVTGQGETPVRLMWTGAHEETNLKPGLPVAIPLVIRANENHPEAPIYGIVLPKGQVYVTDITFLKDRVASRPLTAQPDGHYRFTVRVHYRGDRVAVACFVVDIGSGGRLHVHHVECEDS